MDLVLGFVTPCRNAARLRGRRRVAVVAASASYTLTSWTGYGMAAIAKILGTLSSSPWTRHDLHDLSQGNALMRAQLHTR